ncbi:MAG: HAMP domain-containing protein [Anaerolineae bacterium]|nr:HAMP domain-containing protein [Anaerolineae bacterium]
MTIRSIVLLIIFVSFAFLLGVVSLASNGVLLQSFADLENSSVLHDGQRMFVSVSDELTSLAAVTRDYAAWSDTYEYIHGRNPEYLKQNYFDELFPSLRFNLVLIADRDGKIVFAKEVYGERRAEITHSQTVTDFMARYSGLFHHTDVNSALDGLADFGGIPVLAASRPILPEYSVGPVSGTLVFARYLDGGEVARLAEKAEYNFTVSRAHMDSLSADVLATQTKLVIGAKLDTSKPLVRPISDSQISTELVANDVNGAPLLLFTSVAPRSIYIQGRAAADYVAKLAGLVGLASLLVSLLLMEKALIRPIGQLISAAHDIARNGRPAERMKPGGSADLRNLAASINEMLDALQRTQDELALSVAENRAILDAIPDIMLHIKPDGVVKWAVAPEDYPHKDVVASLVGQNMYTLRDALPVYSESDEARGLAALREALKDGGNHVIEILSLETGLPRDMEVRLSTLRTAGNGVLALIRDITERRNAETAERNAVLLKEIHHRVKNNLQVVISLLNLQAAQAPSPEVAAMFHDSQDRVRSMALVHEKLYNSRDLSRIEFADYIRDLTDRLMNTYEMTASAIQLEVVASPTFLDIDTAMSCGLIVSELVTNALKHAFQGRTQGKLTIRLARGSDGMHEVVVCDDGIGLPEQVDIAGAETLGLQLVTSLVRQIGGTLTLRRDKGAAFHITFRPPADSNRSKEHGG